MGEFNLIEILAKLGVQYVPFLFALCFHEYAHGYIAKKKGDNTAEVMGRLSLNPFVHADLFGTFILPIAGIIAGIGGMNGGHGFIFGWAKPVPVNVRNLKNSRKDMFWIALAGPLSNLLLAIIGIIIYVLIGIIFREEGIKTSLLTVSSNFVMINMLLCFFNLIPLHPLDGGKVLARFLPHNWNRFLEDQQMASQMVLIMFMVAGGFQYLAVPMMWATDAIFNVVTFAFGTII